MMKRMYFNPLAIREYCSHIFLLFACFIFALTFSSCATIFCTKKDVPALTITSNVPDADVYINGKYVGKTPYSHFGDGKKCDAKKIMVKKEGYKSQTEKPRKLSGWAYVNFIPWPLYNWIWGYFLDRSKTKCWKYKQDVYYFELEEKKK